MATKGLLGRTETGLRTAFVNGSFVSEDDAKLSVFDRGILHGDAVFETAFAWNGRIFKLDQHLSRIARSLKVVRIELPMSLDELKSTIVEVVRRNELQNAYIKWIVTRGVGNNVLLDPTGLVASVVVFAREYLYLTDPKKARDGITTTLSQTRRTPHESLDPRIKNINYLNLVMARMEAVDGGYDEVLMMDAKGHITEAPGYNVFAVRDGTVHTPARGILEGITRETVLEICDALKIPFLLTDLLPYDLYNADEIFLTSTAGGLIPVRSVDRREVSAGVPGPTFARIRDAYTEMIERGEHGTPVSGRA